MIRFVVVLVFVISCSEKKSSGSSVSLTDTPEGKAVEQVLKNYYSDMSDRDWVKYRQHFWDGATITTAWQQPGDSAAAVHVITIDDFIRQTPQGPDSQPIFEEKMKDSRISVQGNLAEAWVGYEAKFGSPDSLAQWTGTDVFTLLRHDGQWKIVSLVFESDE